MELSYLRSPIERNFIRAKQWVARLMRKFETCRDFEDPEVEGIRRWQVKEPGTKNLFETTSRKNRQDVSSEGIGNPWRYFNNDCILRQRFFTVHSMELDKRERSLGIFWRRTLISRGRRLSIVKINFSLFETSEKIDTPWLRYFHSSRDSWNINYRPRERTL